MEKKDTKIEKMSALIFAISAIMVSFAPYQVNSTLTLHSNMLSTLFRSCLYLFVAINTILIIFPYFMGKKVKKTYLFQLLPILIFFLITTLHTYSNEIRVSGILTIFQCIIFALSNEKIKLQTFNYLKKFVIIICALGIICYINYILKLFLPYQVVAYYGRNSAARYIDYKIIFLYLDFKSNMIRLCGSFNEPGALGTVAALVLCAGDIKLKNKENIIILIGCILTFSLASVLIIFIYLLFKYSKSIKTLIIVIVLVFLYINVLPNIKTNDDSINRLIERMTLTENGFIGDTRNGADLEYIFEYSLKNKPLFGYGDGYLSTLTLKPYSTYKSYIIEYGIVGSVLIWGILLLSALYKNKNNINILFYVIVFFSSIYQRPHIINLLYLIILFGGTLYVKKDTDAKKRIKFKNKEIDM